MTTKPSGKPSPLVLRLYIAGNGPNSVRAVANAKSLRGEDLLPAHQLEIVDMLEHPLRALADGVLVTPTLLRISPSPVLRVIGNLSDTREVLLALTSP